MSSKSLKSFLKPRTLFSIADAHVKAVYTVCLFVNFINRYLAKKSDKLEKFSELQGTLGSLQRN
jgi:hypothetical protein